MITDNDERIGPEKGGGDEAVPTFLDRLDPALRAQVCTRALSLRGGAWTNPDVGTDNPLWRARRRARLPIPEVGAVLGMDAEQAKALELLCGQLSAREILTATAAIMSAGSRRRAAYRASRKKTSTRHFSRSTPLE